MDKTTFPETLQEAIIYFADPENALSFMAALRWPDGKAHCPRCDSENAGFLKTRRLWKCRDCAKQFSVKAGTVFENSPLGLDKWLPAVWLIVNAKNGISSCEIARALGVTQKTGWFVLHRIRLAMQNGSFTKMGGIVEADETFIGGLAKNMHEGERAKRIKGRGASGKDVVMGLLERGNKNRASRVRAKVVKTTDRASLHAEIESSVSKGACVFTDALPAYAGLDRDYIHAAVDHAVEYVSGMVHTNGLENFWSLLKRTVKGTYVSVNAEHLFRYLDEQTFRYNERKDNDKGRFLKAIAGIIGRRLTYLSLIAKDGECLPAL
jgi:transposase-like protein